LGVVLVIAALAAIVAVLSVVRGFVLSYLWQWFVVPFGLPSITVAHAIGISLIVSFLTYEGAKTESNDIGEAIGNGVGQTLLVFFIGWIVHVVMAG
jgi:hypothetical protein